MNEILAPGKQRTRILHVVSDSLPQSVRFSAAPADGAGEPSGLVEVERSVVLLAQRRETFPLQPENSLRKGMFDTVYAVYVTPETDTRIVFRTRHFRSRWLWLALGLVLAAGLVAGLLPLILR